MRTTATMPSVEYRPKPATAAWISRERKRAKMTVADLRERLHLMGIEVTEQTIRVWEGNSGRPPGPERLDALQRIFGSAAPDRPSAGDQSDVAAAIREQTEAIKEQTRTLLEALRSRDSILEGLLHELGSYRQVQGGLVETLVAALEQSRGVDPADDPSPEPRGAARR